MGMKFDVVVGNPPFSKANEGKTANKKPVALYPKFYKWAVENADVVAMIIPSSDRKLGKGHNNLIRKTANIISHIDPKLFNGIVIPMWYLISDKNDPNKANIDWVLNGSVGNNIAWTKGKTIMPIYKNKTGHHGTPAPASPDDITIYHKLSERSGLVVKYSDPKFIPEPARFPQSGYAVLLPQTITDHGWSMVEVVACNGRQTAFHGMTVVFVSSLEEADNLINLMKTPSLLKEQIK